MRMEFGVLLTSGFNKEIFTNVVIDNQLTLYSDYLNKFGNVDVDWQVNVNMKVNEFIKASIGAHMRYDDDVKFKEDLDGDGELPVGTGQREGLGPLDGDAGELCEFVVMHTFFSEQATTSSIEAVRRGAERAGRDPDAVRIWSCYATVHDGIDPDLLTH